MMNPKTVVAAPTAAELVGDDSDYSPAAIEPQMPRGSWTRDIEELCRALDAQQRAQFPSTDPKENAEEE